jgi:hypothetical protein
MLLLLVDIEDNPVKTPSRAMQKMTCRKAKLACFGNDGTTGGDFSRLRMASNKRVSHASECMGAASLMGSNAA